MEHLDTFSFDEAEHEEALSRLDDIRKNGIANFPSLRDGQVDALTRIFTSIKNKKKNIILIAPTGSGKSAIAATAAQILYETIGSKSYILPPSRALQDQYIKDLLVDDHFKVAKGADNYRCAMIMRIKDPVQRSNKVLTEAEMLTYSVAAAPCKSATAKVREEHLMSGDLLVGKKEWFKTAHADQDAKVRKGVSEIVTCGDSINEIYKNVSQAEVARSVSQVSGPMVKRYCAEKHTCPHLLARSEADEAPAAILNLNMLCFYLHSGVSSMLDVLGRRSVHIFDEAHNLENAFREVLSLKISQNMYNDLFKALYKDTATPWTPMSFLEFKKSKQPEFFPEEVYRAVKHVHASCEQFIWKTYVEPLNKLFDGKFKSVEEFLKERGVMAESADIDADNESYKKTVSWFKNTFYAIKDYDQYKDRPHFRKYHFWMTMEASGTHTLNIVPIELGIYCKKFLAEDVNIFMSATIPDANMFSKILGLKPEDTDIINMPDPFPVQSHPIFLEAVEKNTTSRLTEIGAEKLKLGDPKILSTAERKQCYEAGADSFYDRTAMRLGEILAKFNTLNGVGFVTGYNSVHQIKRRMNNNDRLIFAENGEDNRKKLEVFKNLPADSNAIFISAGIKEGHSFDDEMSRLQLIFKVPFSPPEEILNLLNRRYPGYSNVQTAISLQQQVGRSMRSKDDFCITIIFDGMFSEIMGNTQHSKYYSQSFKDSIQWSGDWRNVVFDSEKISY